LLFIQRDVQYFSSRRSRSIWFRCAQEHISGS